MKQSANESAGVSPTTAVRWRRFLVWWCSPFVLSAALNVILAAMLADKAGISFGEAMIWPALSSLSVITACCMLAGMLMFGNPPPAPWKSAGTPK